jgi:geranylgeranyl diphosphate synthase, type I
VILYNEKETLEHSMTKPQEIAELFKEYSTQIDDALRAFFSDLPDRDMYAHLAYFMGFRDEKLVHIQGYGGKRFRSGIALMLGDWYGLRFEMLPIALSIELFHNFTLIHDDIVDGDTLRRGRPTVWKMWGVPHAINDGDAQALLASSIIATSTAEPRRVLDAHTFLMKQYVRVTEGQFLDFTLTDIPLGDLRVTEEAYCEMIERKTADLIVASTGVVGTLAMLPSEECIALESYGRNLGMAYQVCDDVISIWGDAQFTGKRPHNDLYERKKTLPVLYALARLGEDDRTTLTNLYNKKEPLTESDVAVIISLLEKVGTYAYMRDEVSRYAHAAKAATELLGVSEKRKEKLKDVVDVLLPDIKSA